MAIDLQDTFDKKENTMAFVNEYMTQEDVKKYGFEELVQQYVTFAGREGFLREPDWTVDKERESWLCWFRNETDNTPNAFDHATTRESVFILHYKGKNIEARVWLEEDSKLSIYKSPYIVIWRFISISPSSFEGVEETEIKAVLQEALSAYGSAGIRAQGEEKNAIVEFRNFSKEG